MECCVHSPREQCWSGITEEVAVLSDGGCGTQLTASVKVLPHAPLMDMLDFASRKDCPWRSPVASTRRARNVGN
ncbi:hypothetical protein B7P43_G17322 [Cryptotermes secundus]|uniref:Uncharacterized protein n=1 Tax=Cryptotermes secundus TaxID=105785 RepID=A0A2J7QY93_9NEOP|nr:hypothetical protein B7P43_G17322 [Cryptotermes secundus]